MQEAVVTIWRINCAQDHTWTCIFGPQQDTYKEDSVDEMMMKALVSDHAFCSEADKVTLFRWAPNDIWAFVSDGSQAGNKLFLVRVVLCKRKVFK